MTALVLTPRYFLASHGFFFFNESETIKADRYLQGGYRDTLRLDPSFAKIASLPKGCRTLAEKVQWLVHQRYMPFACDRRVYFMEPRQDLGLYTASLSGPFIGERPYFIDDETLLVANSPSEVVQIFEIDSGRLKKQMPRNLFLTDAPLILRDDSKNRSCVVTGFNQKEKKLTLSRFLENSDEIVLLKADGNVIVAAHSDRSIKIWDMKGTNTCLCIIEEAFDDALDEVMIGEHHLAHVSQKGILKIWEVPSGNLIFTASTHACDLIQSHNGSYRFNFEFCKNGLIYLTQDRNGKSVGHYELKDGVTLKNNHILQLDETWVTRVENRFLTLHHERLISRDLTTGNEKSLKLPYLPNRYFFTGKHLLITANDQDCYLVDLFLLNMMPLISVDKIAAEAIVDIQHIRQTLFITEKGTFDNQDAHIVHVFRF